MAQFDFLEVTLSAGDCMYVPAYYYVQSRTVGKGLDDETIMLAEQYESHSKFFDVVLDGLETEDLTDDETHNMDRILYDLFSFLH